MKTFIAFFAAIFLIANPVLAEKYKPSPVGCDGRNTHSSFRHSKKSYSSPLKPGRKARAMKQNGGKSISGNSAHRIHQKNKAFESPKNKLSSWRKNPNHTKSQFRDGGFYSFRRHSYSAHIFNGK